MKNDYAYSFSYNRETLKNLYFAITRTYTRHNQINNQHELRAENNDP